MPSKTLIMSMNLQVSFVISETLKWGITSATSKINKENGSNSTIAVSTLSTQLTYKPNALVDHILIRMNMIGIKDRTVRVHISSAIEEKIEVISKLK